MAGGHLAGHKSTAADLGAWLCWEDESGQGLRPPKGRTWGRRGRTPVVTVTGGSNTRVSLAALIAVRPGCGPRLIFRTHRARRGDTRKGFTETDYARFLDAAHQQLGGPLVLVIIQVAITSRTLSLGGTIGPVKFMNAAQLNALDHGYTYGLLWLAGAVILLGAVARSGSRSRGNLRFAR